MDAGSESLTVCDAFGLSNEMVTLREPTLRGDRGERGGETESSLMVDLARRAPAWGAWETVSRSSPLGGARSPKLLGAWELRPLASRWRLCGNYNGVEGARILS